MVRPRHLGEFLLGLAVSALVPAWRLALYPGLAVLGLHVVTAAAVGFLPRYSYPPFALMHVVAFGGALFIVRQLAPAIGRLRRVAGAAPLPRQRDASVAPELRLHR